MTRRTSFVVYGQVQRVSFRYFTQKKAKSYKLTGWVRNTQNGAVEGEAQGEDADVDSLLTDLKSGPSHATVEKVEKRDVDVVDGEKGFVVRG